jgi:amino acid transporter
MTGTSNVERMTFREHLFGRPLQSSDEAAERIGPARAVPILGLDALSSAAYGPEAALTVLLLAGVRGAPLIVPITGAVIALLAIVCVSYRQTIGAYPNGGGSYTVARENLGPVPGLVAAAALIIDYVLNVAVGISAGVGALVSALPFLLPHTLHLSLGILVLLTFINLRGVRSSGAALAVPTYLFLGCLGVTVVWGVGKTLLAGHGTASAGPSLTPMVVGTSAGTWLILRSFASGCTAMTGVEAVSNATPLFREPRVSQARQTLTLIVVALIVLLSGVALLSRGYHIEATPPGTPGYRSVISEVLEAVAGRGFFYYFTISAVVAVLCLSANTSFADFPRVCRLLALDHALPLSFAHRGTHLVFARGIVVLSLLSAVLLILFDGITARLIPLFALGAFLAFTMSQFGMVIHWRRQRIEPGAVRALLVNATGAIATGITFIIIAIAKFSSGAWVTLFSIPLLVGLFRTLQDRGTEMRAEVSAQGPLLLEQPPVPLVVVPIRSLDRIGRRGLSFALSISPEVHAVQVLTEDPDEPDLRTEWSVFVEKPLAARHLPIPGLTVIRSPYRELFEPLLAHVTKLTKANPDRDLIVVLAELAQRRWWHAILGTHRATVKRDLLLLRGGPHLTVLTAPWYVGRRGRRDRWSPR